MRINEIIVEQQLDEGTLGSAVGAVGRGIGKVIGGVAKGVGAIAGIGAGAKKAFQKGKQASTDVIGGTGQGADAPVQKAAPAATAAAPAAAPAGGGPAGGGAAQPAAQPAAGGAAQGGAPAAAPAQPAAQPAAQGGAAQPAAKPAAGGGDVDAIIQQVDQLQPPEKKEVLAALQKPAAPAKEEPAAQPAADANAAAQPAAQSGAEQQPDDGLTQGQRDQQQAVQQMKTTADANAAASGQRNEVEAAGKAAAAKPGFQRTAADKLAIKQAQDMGVKVEDIEDDPTRIREYVEEYILFKPQITRTMIKESRQPKQKFSIYKS